MPNVYPMRPLGADEDDADLLTYVTRDPIGVEDEEALPSDWTGWNEGAEWTGRLEGSYDLEHDLYGVHDTLKIARGIVHGMYDRVADTYFAWANDVSRAGSYLQSSTGDVAWGGTAFALSKVGTGVVQIDIIAGAAFELPSVNARIQDFGSRGFISRANRALNLNGGCMFQTIRLDSVPSVSQLIVRLFKNDTPKDDNFTIGIHGT